MLHVLNNMVDRFIAEPTAAKTTSNSHCFRFLNVHSVWPKHQWGFKKLILHVESVWISGQFIFSNELFFQQWKKNPNHLNKFYKKKNLTGVTNASVKNDGSKSTFVSHFLAFRYIYIRVNIHLHLHTQTQRLKHPFWGAQGAELSSLLSVWRKCMQRKSKWCCTQ